jgi:hypothetical protein
MIPSFAKFERTAIQSSDKRLKLLWFRPFLSHTIQQKYPAVLKP